MCASNLKRPNRSLCQESLWQTRRVKTWQLQSESARDIYQRWREGNTAERQWNYFHYLSSTSFKLKWLETTFCPYKDRRCINLSVSLLWVFCHCLVPSSHVSSSDRPYVLQCCFVRVGRREDLCEEPALIMHEFQLPGEHTTRLAEMERGTEHRQTKQDSCWFKDCPNF